MGGRGDLDWIFGDLLNRRRAFEVENPQVRWSKLVEMLQSNQQTIDEWARHVAAFRATLTNPELAPSKAVSEIDVEACDFDGELLDSLAEWMAPAKLKAFGFNSFTVLVPPVTHKGNPQPTPDFSASRAVDDALVEVKNLRAHECVESAMFRIFYDLKRKGADFSGIRLVINKSFRETLDAHQQRELTAIVATIRTYPLNIIQRVRLINGAEVVFKVIPGAGDVMGMDGISLDDLQSDVEAFAGLLRKIEDNCKKALRQLIAPGAKSSTVRVVAMRWDIPVVSLPFPATLTDAVLSTFKDVRMATGVNADLFVFTDHDYVLATTLQ